MVVWGGILPVHPSHGLCAQFGGCNHQWTPACRRRRHVSSESFQDIPRHVVLVLVVVVAAAAAVVVLSEMSCHPTTVSKDRHRQPRHTLGRSMPRPSTSVATKTLGLGLRYRPTSRLILSCASCVYGSSSFGILSLAFSAHCC